MEPTKQQRVSAIANLNPQQEYLYVDPEAGAALRTIANKHNISSEDQYTAFAIAVGDVILGLVPQEKLPDLLIERLQITRPEAMKVTADVLDFLAPLSQERSVKANTPPAPITENEVLEMEIAQTEVALDSTIQPIRTMAHDMETARQPVEEIHTAPSQSELLSGNQQQNPQATWNSK